MVDYLPPNGTAKERNAKLGQYDKGQRIFQDSLDAMRNQFTALAGERFRVYTNAEPILKVETIRCLSEDVSKNAKQRVRGRQRKSVDIICQRY